MQDLLENLLEKVKQYEDIIIFGCGKNGKIIHRYLKSRMKDKSFHFADSNERYHNKYQGGSRILSLSSAKRLYERSLWIISSQNNFASMYHQLSEMQVDDADIIYLTVNEFRLINKYSYRWFYDEGKYFVYEVGFPIDIKFLLNLAINCFKSIYYKFGMDTIAEHANKQYKYNVTICAIFLNEAPYMREWIEFHKIVGVEHFYLYNNMSTDDHMHILEPYIERGDVTLIDWDIPQGQIPAYRDCVEKFSEEARWIGFIDLDEFVVPHKNKIYDFLKQYDQIWGSVLIYWKLYGSSGIDERDLNGLVTEDFSSCWPKLADSGKCFFNTSYRLSDDEKNGKTLYHLCWTKRKNKDLPPINIYGKLILGEWQRGRKGAIPIQINHYLTKSSKEYKKKIKQPDSTFEINTRSDFDIIFYDEKSTGTDTAIEKYLPELRRRLKK